MPQPTKCWQALTRLPKQAIQCWLDWLHFDALLFSTNNLFLACQCLESSQYSAWSKPNLFPELRGIYVFHGATLQVWTKVIMKLIQTLISRKEVSAEFLPFNCKQHELGCHEQQHVFSSVEQWPAAWYCYISLAHKMYLKLSRTTSSRHYVINQIYLVQELMLDAQKVVWDHHALIIPHFLHNISILDMKGINFYSVITSAEIVEGYCALSFIQVLFYLSHLCIKFYRKSGSYISG